MRQDSWGSLRYCPAVRLKQLRWAGPAPLAARAGLGWWGGATLAVAWQAASGNDVFTRPVVGVLVVGGYAQILAASLTYLGPVLHGGGHRRLMDGFRITRSWPGLVAANVATIALAVDAHYVVVVALSVGLLDTVLRAAAFARAPSPESTNESTGTTR